MPTDAIVPVFVDGRLFVPETPDLEAIYNPSTGQCLGKTPHCHSELIDRAVSSAQSAFATWSQVPVIERARVFFRYRRLLEVHFEELAALVTREHGKTLAESRAEVQRGLEMVEFACGLPSLLMGQNLPNIAGDVDAECIRHPVGTCVGITPYNFPNMVPLWMFPVAIVCGNSFILKPSEKVPLSAMRLAELLHEAGLPPGVFNVVHGGRTCVEHLLRHPQVAAISFVGSTPVAQSIYTTATSLGKRVQAAGGAKNHLIVMPDADMEMTVKAIAASAYGCAGQRCMAGSVAVAVGKAGDALREGLVDFARQLRVGPSDGDESIAMGPVIREEHRQRVAGYLDIAHNDGAEIALDGRLRKPTEAFLIGPSIVDHVRPPMRIYREEIFGPVLSLVRVQDLDEALALGKQCSYGNGASIFTRSGYAARQFKHHFNAGMIGINVGVPAPMAWFPFTGWNRSFFGDLHIQGVEGMQFYTRQKTILTRWPQADDSFHDPVWNTKPNS
jgi:malonate-semialdehyde dehydrogenase (acetylating)/methylmalonate-semialdehyde dehydrogenase